MAAEVQRLQISRRRLVQGIGVTGLGLVAGCGRLPWQAQREPGLHRIGYLTAVSGSGPGPEAFQQGLRDYGYAEGDNNVIEWRFADEHYDRLPGLAMELV